MFKIGRKPIITFVTVSPKVIETIADIGYRKITILQGKSFHTFFFIRIEIIDAKVDSTCGENWSV